MKEQWLVTKESWDKIMDMGFIKWSPGPMGTGTFFIETPDGTRKVEKGDWIVKMEDGTFDVEKYEKG
jgi:hypothetical protein